MKKHQKAWYLLNSPLITGLALLFITLLVGNYLLPKRLADYQLNQKQLDAKYNFSVTFLNFTWTTLFYARNYYLNYKLEPQFPQREERLWNDYYSSIKDWNIKLVTNYFALRKYYGDESRQYFEKEVVSNHIQLHLEILKIHDGETADNQKIENLLSILDNRMYILAEKLNKFP